MIIFTEKFSLLLNNCVSYVIDIVALYLRHFIDNLLYLLRKYSFIYYKDEEKVELNEVIYDSCKFQ